MAAVNVANAWSPFRMVRAKCLHVCSLKQTILLGLTAALLWFSASAELTLLKSGIHLRMWLRYTSVFVKLFGNALVMVA